MSAAFWRRISAAAIAFAAIAFLATFASAQTITGSIRGTVTDPAGAVLPGAHVTAINVATGVKTTTVTDHAGDYNIQFLPVGEYTVTVDAPGFSTTSIAAFQLQIDQIAKIDAKLQVGSASTTITVTSNTSPLLQTQDATLQSTIDSTALATLPLNGQNFQTVTLYVPGSVNPSMAYMASADGNERDADWYGTPSFNGNRAQTNNYIFDGVEMNETINNLAAYNPSPEAIQEMQVITGDANAEYGNVNGGEIMVVTKAGTSHYHGSAYDYFQNNNMAGTSWGNSFAGVPSTPFTQDQFGASFGGPVLRNRLFFFGDYEGFRYHNGGLGYASVATSDMRKGDFSALLQPQYGGIQLYNNQNGAGYTNATEYTNNQVPIVNPVAKYLFAHPNVYPMPNKAPVAGTLDEDNYVGPTKGHTVNNQGDVRVDYTIGQRDTLMGRYSYGDAYDFTPQPVLPTAFPSLNDYPFQSFVSNWVHTFSPNLQNEFRAGVTREVVDQGVPSDPTGLFGSGGDNTIGLPFSGQAFPGFSQMQFSGVESNIGTTAIVTEFHENNFFYGDDFTWQHGRHTTRFGAQIVRYQQNTYYSGNSGALGGFYYNGQYTANGLTGSPGYSFADFVLDQGASAAVGGVSGDNGQRQYRNAYYVQDDWRVRPNLTLNLGLRYAHDQPIYEVNNKEASVDLSNMNDISASGIEFAGKNGNSRALYNPFYLEFMPRLGFAWEVTPRFVVRGGYGITDDLEGTGLNWRMTMNAPFQGSFVASPTAPTTTSSGLAPLPVENGFSLGPGALQVSYFNYQAWDPHLKPAMIQQFNLGWQMMIDNNTSAQVGYVGELGQHLVIPMEADQFFTPASGVLADGDCSGTIAPAAPACNLVGNEGNLQVTESEGYSNYNALQTTLHHRTANGLQFVFNYTWAKAMTNNAGFYGVAGVSEASSFLQDFRNPHGDYGPAGQDARNSFNGYLTYAMPFGRGMRFGSNISRALDEAVGGWRLSTGVVMYSGFPLTMYSYEDYYVNSWAAHAMHFRHMGIRNRTVQNWFGTDPSATPCITFDPNGNTHDNGTCAYGVESFNGFGNAQNGSERAPGFRQVDLSAFKTFKITEGETLELRGDAFNALNIASYAAPISQLEYLPYGIFGQIRSTNSSQRIMQVSMHYRF
jgi:outer membrane receptor protein involved in Fe transport